VLAALAHETFYGQHQRVGAARLHLLLQPVDPCQHVPLALGSKAPSAALSPHVELQQRSRHNRHAQQLRQTQRTQCATDIGRVRRAGKVQQQLATVHKEAATPLVSRWADSTALPQEPRVHPHLPFAALRQRKLARPATHSPFLDATCKPATHSLLPLVNLQTLGFCTGAS
jgi:hypothetical protein